MLDSLRDSNQWWSTGKVSYKKAILAKREELKKIIDQLSEERITLLVGARRVGKSTLMFNTIEYLIDSGVYPSNILFFSADNPKLIRSTEDLGAVLDFYEKEVLSTPFYSFKEKIYVFIDEIHIAKGWQVWIKDYYEKYGNLKFVISGSSASHLFENSKESLLGRCLTINIFPLSLWQFAVFKNKLNHLMAENDFSRLLSLIPKTNLIKEPLEYYNSLKDNYVQISFYEKYFAGIVSEYLLVGGYLEFFSSSNIYDWQSKLLDIVYYGLYRDIIDFYEVSSGKILENLFRFIAENSGQPFSYNNIGKILGISPITVTNYLTFLEKAHLIIIQETSSSHSSVKIKSNKKIHILDNGLRNSVNGDDILSDTRIGFCVETAVASYAYNVCKDNNWILNYKDKNEIDAIVNKKNSVLPIEVKYRNKLNPKDFQSIKEYNPGVISIVVTKSTLKRENNTLFIPFWLIK